MLVKLHTKHQKAKFIHYIQIYVDGRIETILQILLKLKIKMN